ncbi:MAG: hypothetical protein H7346_00540 [Burkholderiaceae bacterium]|nr:hypothetical protein [Burkholderiaceae bacterium]
MVSGSGGWASTAEARRYFLLGESGDWTGSAFGFYDMGQVEVFRQPIDTKPPQIKLGAFAAASSSASKSWAMCV